MTTDEFDALKKSIEQHGQRDPVIFIDDEIVDGAHRWRACEELGIPCRTVPYQPSIHGESLVDLAMDRNFNRRQLSASQRAQIAVDALPLYEAEAKSRQSSPLRATLPEVKSERSRDIVAAKAGVSPRLVQDAKAVAQASPELAAQVKAGTKTVTAAKRELAAPPPPPPDEDLPPPEADPIAEAIAQGERFRELVNQAHQLRRDIEALASEPIGRELGGTRLQSVQKDIKNIVSVLKFAEPAGACTYYSTDHSGCKACRGSGWLGAGQLKQMPKAQAA